MLDPLDIPARLDELRNIKDGWLDGYGKAPDHQGLDWFSQSFQRYYPDDLQLPHIYPTPEGGIQAEWSLATYESSLEVDLSNRTGEWHSLDVSTNDSTLLNLNLGAADDWDWFTREIGRLEGRQSE